MASKDIKNLNDADLVKQLAEKRDEIRKARFAMHGASGKDVMKPHNLRKDIARIMTELRTREIANANQK